MRIILSVLVVALTICSGYGQDLQKPSEGTSLVYIMRTSGVGALVNFKYFDGDQYLGKFAGANYVLYECEPGEHLFWASAENRDFMPATLEANKTYIINAEVLMGAMKARVNLAPVDRNDEKVMKRVNKLLSKKSPKNFVDKDIAQAHADLSEYIKISLEKYEENKSVKDYEVLDANMHHSD